MTPERVVVAVVVAPNVERGPCDFCGNTRRVAVSELGQETPERPEVARICAPCAAWAFGELAIPGGWSRVEL